MAANIKIFLSAMEETLRDTFSADYKALPHLLPPKKQLKELIEKANALMTRWEFYESLKVAKKRQKKKKK